MLTSRQIRARLKVDYRFFARLRHAGLPLHQSDKKKQILVSKDDLREFALSNPHLFGGLERDRLRLVFDDDVANYLCCNFPPPPRPCKPKKEKPPRSQLPRKGVAVQCVETEEIFRSQSEAARSIHVRQSSIRQAIKKNYRSGGYHWQRINTNPP